MGQRVGERARGLHSLGSILYDVSEDAVKGQQ